MKKVVLLMLSMTAGCAATPLNPGAERVIVSRTPAPRGCRFQGAVIGKQGDFFTGRYTSNENLAEGALNELRNRAAALDANYVVLETNNAGMTLSGGRYGTSGAQTDVTNTGNAYLCRPQDIGLEPLPLVTMRQAGRSDRIPASARTSDDEPAGSP